MLGSNTCVTLLAQVLVARVLTNAWTELGIATAIDDDDDDDLALVVVHTVFPDARDVQTGTHADADADASAQRVPVQDARWDGEKFCA